MPAILIEPPAGEPLSLAEARNYLKVGHSADDALIQSQLAAARITVEARTRRALLVQRWRIVLDAWPHTPRIASPVSPLRQVIAARVRDAHGNPVPLETGMFICSIAAAPGEIHFDPGRVREPERLVAGIEIDIEAGYGEAADVPAPLLEAIRLLLARAYEYRDRPAPAPITDAIAELIAPYRVLGL
jgi:uncharacterized phiE125 gp8 family phage protein